MHVLGRVIVEGDSRHIDAFAVRVVQDHNAMTLHLLEVVYAHMRLAAAAPHRPVAAAPFMFQEDVPVTTASKPSSSLHEQVRQFFRTLPELSEAGLPLAAILLEFPHVSAEAVGAVLHALSEEGIVNETEQDVWRLCV